MNYFHYSHDFSFFQTKKVNKRVPVVAVGNFGDTIADQADSIKRIYATGVQCVVINVSTVCAQEQGKNRNKKGKMKLKRIGILN